MFSTFSKNSLEVEKLLDYTTEWNIDFTTEEIIRIFLLQNRLW